MFSSKITNLNMSNMPVTLEFNCKCYVKQNNYLQLKSYHIDRLRGVQLLALCVRNQRLPKLWRVDPFLPQKRSKGKTKCIKYEQKVIEKKK